MKFPAHLHFLTALAISFLTGVALLPGETAKAEGYDIDCKVILCLAGGFPTGCANAYNYMIDRISRVPPLPPFGFCGFNNGTEYTNYEADFRFLGNDPNAYDCPEGTQLFYQEVKDGEGGNSDVTVFCYEEAIQSTNFSRGDEEAEIIYLGRTQAQRVNSELSITLEPGTPSEYRSPLFRINTITGYTYQRAAQ